MVEEGLLAEVGTHDELVEREGPPPPPRGSGAGDPQRGGEGGPPRPRLALRPAGLRAAGRRPGGELFELVGIEALLEERPYLGEV